MSFQRKISERIRKNGTYIICTSVERSRREAAAEVRRCFREARRNVPLDCHCDEHNRVCECFTPGLACEQRLIAEITASGQRRIFWLMQAVRAFVLPGRPIPTYQNIADAAMLREGMNFIE